MYCTNSLPWLYVYHVISISSFGAIFNGTVAMDALVYIGDKDGIRTYVCRAHWNISRALILEN